MLLTHLEEDQRKRYFKTSFARLFGKHRIGASSPRSGSSISNLVSGTDVYFKGHQSIGSFRLMSLATSDTFRYRS